MRPTEFSELHAVASAAGTPVEIRGWISPFEVAAKASYFALVEEASCCVGCLPRDAGRRIEVFADRPVPITGRRIRLKGILREVEPGDSGWRYQLREAMLAVESGDEEAPFNRRQVLQAATLACLAIASGEGTLAFAQEVTEATARDAIRDMATVDVHSHEGAIIGRRRVEGDAGFTPVAAPMREGGMAVLCLATVSDAPVHHVTPDRRIRPFRDPHPGELYAYGQLSFLRIHKLAKAQGLDLIRDAGALGRARSERPGIVVTAEGGDFLEGQVDRVDEAYDQWALRHLQLTHYRVNELGDIQTEPPEHGGLTDIGAEVIRRCNRLGIVVDVAHGTYDLVKRAAEVSGKPLVLSHTSLTARPRPNTRLITLEHARIVAGTGGVVGVWPPASIFPDLAAMSAGMARMVDAIGIDHVALGTDMRGLVGPSTFDTYRDLPALSQALLARGFQVGEVRKMLGGNYERVFVASLKGDTSSTTTPETRS